jgi:hypothetical protein
MVLPCPVYSIHLSMVEEEQRIAGSDVEVPARISTNRQVPRSMNSQVLLKIDLKGLYVGAIYNKGSGDVCLGVLRDPRVNISAEAARIAAKRVIAGIRWDLGHVWVESLGGTESDDRARQAYC